MYKTVIIGPAYPFRGGIASFNERLAAEMQAGGDSARIETFTLQYPGILFPGKTQYADSPARPDTDISRSINSIWPPSWIRTGMRIRKERPDIVIFRYWLPFMAPCFGTMAGIIGKNRHTKILSIVDNIIPHEKRPGDSLLTNYFVRHINGFLAMSEAVLSELSSFDNDKPRIYSPHPVFDNFGESISREQALEKLGLDPGYRYILFFGLVRKYKGLDIMINAFANRAFRNMKIKLLVAGEFYTPREPYDEMIKEHGLEKDIIIHPSFVPDSEVASWFCASDIVAQPYRSATQSGVTQIGYHFNKPMLVTDVGGLSEIIPHGRGGYVVSPDPQAVADALLDFFNNNRHSEYSEGIRTEKEKFSWKRLVDNIYSLSELVNK